MASTHLARVTILGVAPQLEIAEDTITALGCMDVTDVRRGETHFEIEGWVPDAWVDELSAILEEASGGLAILTVEEAADAAEAPVLLQNPRISRPFEVLVEMFSLPGRGDFDPTRITSFVLPLFFGFIIGDAGYGAVLVAAAWAIRRRVTTPIGRLTARILAMGGAWAVAFGLLVFHEAFAFLLVLPLVGGPIIDRHVDIIPLLVISVAVGLVHLALGILIGFRDERRRAGLRLAVFRKASWLLIEAGVVVLGLVAIGFVAGASAPWALALLGLGVLLVGLGGGYTDILEVPSFLTDVLSYVRLGALGIAEVLLGGTVNQLALVVARSDGVPAWILGAAVFLAGHAAFLGFAVLVVTLQVIRLHYVEFYPRFYHLDDAGRARPFRAVTTSPE